MDDLNDIGPLRAGTHLPLLVAAMLDAGGPVVEVGIGHCSTPLLHAACKVAGRELVSVEGDSEWFEYFRSRYETPGHRFLLGYQHLPDLAACDWGVVLSDESPGSRRIETIQTFADAADYIVVHDVQSADVMDPIRPYLDGFRHWTDDRYDVHAMMLSKYYDLPAIV